MNKVDTEQEHTVQGFDPHIMFENGFSFSSIDLVQGGSFKEVVGRIVPFIWMAVKNRKGNHYFSGISIILPPDNVTSLTHDFVHQSIASGIMALRGYEASSAELEMLKRIVRVVNCSTLEVTDLVEAAVSEGLDRLIAIAEVSIYRDKNIISKPIFGISAVQISEDLWTKHVVSLCRQCVDVIKQPNGYALLHVEDIPAISAENTKLLVGIDNCYVSRLIDENDPEVIFNQKLHGLFVLGLTGQVTEVVKEVEKLGLSEIERLSVLAQLFQRIGLNSEALGFIDQIQPYIQSLKPTQCVKLSRVAYQAGDNFLARSLLPKDASNISEDMWLEVALELAIYFRENEKIESFDARLALLFPHSEVLKEKRDSRLILNCRKEKFGDSDAFTTAGFTDRHLTLLESLQSSDPSYQKIIYEAKTWSVDWEELAIICCTTHAMSIGRLRDAVDMASKITESDLYGRQATLIMLSTLRKMMLKEDISIKEQDYYRDPLLKVVRFLANHPGDGAIRTAFLKLLSVESCGDLGIPIISLIMLDLAADGALICGTTKIEMSELEHANEINEQEPNDDTIKAIVENSFKWIQAQGGAEFGVTILPAEIIGSHSDFIINYLSRIISRICEQQNEDTDLKFMAQMVLLVSVICPHATKERNEDIRVMRLLAGHYALDGQFQEARNLAEQVLLMGQGNDTRLRLAWLTFADIYHRCNNKAEALAGLACALACDVAVEKADLWQEVYLATRIMRDLGLHEYARDFIPALKRLLLECGLDPLTDPRIITTELSLRFSELERNDSDFDGINLLMDDLARRCKEATKGRTELLPLAILLGQVVRKAEVASILVGAETRNILTTALNMIGQKASKMVETISSSLPDPSDVIALFNSVQRATYAIDASGDYMIARLAANRLLDSHSQQSLPIEAKILAVELLADHTLTLPDLPPDMEVDWPVRYAQSLNQEGLDVVFLATDNNGELLVNYVSEGKTFSIEQPIHQKTFHHRMLLWLEKYPRNYGFVEAAHGNNDFFTTMEELDIRLPISDTLVVIATPMLQQLTSNLIIVKSDDGGISQFIGTKTAIGMVPSLTWLSIIRASTRSNKKAYKAWISTPEALEDSGALGIALSRLSGDFEDFGFTVDTGQRLPRDMSDAGLAVITAHGVLTSEGRYIHSIRDEGELIEAPAALALALEGVEVVILFVCSGGRIDNHPWDNRTVSLPKELLNRGSRAVIASPWPLDVKVTYRWLEPFLRGWESGLTILQATKDANEAVSRALGDSPQYSLAMTVYGDVLLTK
ncbi:CHAT domain-containing protein [Shewanella frigidimarina]|uniref:CHAT domain-containing protein n=1 Tax=Shewanella frigidimarina TaxID=56812 RepID=UPI003D78FEBA